MTTPSEIFHKEHFLNKKKILELRTISCFTLQISYPHLRNLLYEATWSHLRWTRQWEEGRTDQRTRGLWYLWEMSRANQIAPREFAFKAWTTSQDHCQTLGLGNDIPCAGLSVTRRLQMECMATGRETAWVWESKPLQSCLGCKPTSHFQAWLCWAFFAGFQGEPQIPTMNFHFLLGQVQMSIPCEQMSLTTIPSVNKSWTSDNTMIQSLDGRHCGVEWAQSQCMREQKQMVYCSSIWMNLGGIMLSERSQSQKVTLGIIHFYVIFAKTKLQWWRTDGWIPEAGIRRQWLQMSSPQEFGSFKDPCLY